MVKHEQQSVLIYTDSHIFKRWMIYFISRRAMAQICIHFLKLDSGGQLTLKQVSHSGKHIHRPVCRSIISSSQLLLSLPTTILKYEYASQSTMSDPTGNDTRRRSDKVISPYLFIANSNVSAKVAYTREIFSFYFQRCMYKFSLCHILRNFYQSNTEFF
jgi:hypothetical protein